MDEARLAALEAKLEAVAVDIREMRAVVEVVVAEVGPVLDTLTKHPLMAMFKGGKGKGKAA